MNGTQEFVLRHGPTDPGWLDVVLGVSLAFLVVAMAVGFLSMFIDIWRRK